MECKNHPGVPAVDRCSGCAEPFCPDCLVEIQGQKYCAACKTMALRGGMPAIPDDATIPCKEANEALTYALVGLVCVGFVMGPIGISKALKAKRMMKLNPRLTGSGKATAALIIGIMDLVFNVLYIVSRIANLNHQ